MVEINLSESERCFSPLTKADLEHLTRVVRKALIDKVYRSPVSGTYSQRLALLTLCQGGAKHFVDSRTGIKDLDVWAFFREGLEKPFPCRARWIADFGESHLGRGLNEPDYQGRRIDILGRSIPVRHDPAEAVVSWLASGRKSSSLLEQKPVTGLFPEQYFCRVIWPGAT